MYLFSVLNLALCVFLEDSHRFQAVLGSEWFRYAGLALMVSNFVASFFKPKKWPYGLRYDLFAVGALLVWAQYWPPFFRFGTPMFFVFPIYFLVMSVFVSSVFIVSRERIPEDTLKMMQWLSDSGRFNPHWIMAGVMLSLYFPQHFLLFPSTITLLLFRFALACCLDNE
jgi:hypothetical protein